MVRALSRDFFWISHKVEFQHLIDSDPALLHLFTTDTYDDEPEWKVDLGQTATTCDAMSNASTHPQCRLVRVRHADHSTVKWLARLPAANLNTYDSEQEMLRGRTFELVHVVLLLVLHA